jgi:hypothetical protein
MLASITALIGEHLALVIGAVIMLIGLLGVGFADTRRFSPTRVAAIASVCFRQSIRRRVLWITPLVILGIIIVTQFQRPLDAQDAIRQTTGYCLFATGMLMALVIIVLACTNLPREIESRVIYTIATKPTTRLEIIVGKVVGFAGVSACILLIMGTFTAIYLHWQDWHARAAIQQQLAAEPADTNRERSDVSRSSLEYYRDAGTLHARKLGLAENLNIYAHAPRDDKDRFAPGSAAIEGQIHARFTIDPEELPPTLAPSQEPTIGPAAGGGALILNMTVFARPAEEPKPATQTTTAPTTRSAEPARPPAYVNLDLLNAQRQELVNWRQMIGAAATPRSRGVTGRALRNEDLAWEGGRHTFNIPIESDFVLSWLLEPGPNEVYVQLEGGSGWDYTLESMSLRDRLINPRWERSAEAISYVGHRGQYGQRLKGSQDHDSRVAVYEFRELDVPPGPQFYPIELRTIVELDYRSENTGAFATCVSLQFRNRKSGYTSAELPYYPESNRLMYVNIPAQAVQGGDFDMLVRMKTGGFVTLRPSSFKLVLADQSFLWNLAKSLSVLWLMSLLIIIVSICCSTFLSWPIAVVLTLAILSGRWATEQVGDILGPGMGAQVVQDLAKGASPGSARAVSKSLDVLGATLKTVAPCLPDLSRFAAIEDIQRGVAIDYRTLLASLEVALGFGLPLIVLSYIFLKYKEVAP